MTPWPHQPRAYDQALAAFARGERRVVLAMPTGSGKTRVLFMLARNALDRGQKVILYTNRRALLDQTSRVMQSYGLWHGVRAAEHRERLDYAMQVSSIQTEAARVLRGGTWGLHEAGLVLVDEAHVNVGEKTAAPILRAHYEAGACILGATATPIGLGDYYDVLLQPARMQELRDYGAIVPALHYGPDEPDLRRFQKLRAKLEAGENLSEADQRSAMPPPAIWGRVWQWYERLNPERKPSILFASGVRESLWFAEQFTQKGVSAAHIDGESVWMNGHFYKNDRAARDELLLESKNGGIKVVCNRFVLREGIDAPWLAHGILATIFGSVQSYVQSGGRLLRAHPGLDNVTIADHGGNWWRHGSLNADRAWSLQDTPASAFGRRADRLRASPVQPFACPNCNRTWQKGRVCLPAFGGCGYEIPPGQKASRAVLSTDGRLSCLTSDPFPARRICQQPSGPAIWERMYWRSRTERARGRTFRAAMALFAMENYWQWPDPTWPFMPLRSDDVYRPVAHVPVEDLVPKETVSA